MQDAGCRAAWIPSVNATTFGSELCTLSGFYKKVLEKTGTLVPTSNTITNAPGFNSLFQVQSVYDVSSSSFSVGYGSPGYVSDLAVNGNTGDSLNPLLKAGWQFCQCVAVAVHGCDPTQPTPFMITMHYKPQQLLKGLETWPPFLDFRSA